MYFQAPAGQPASIAARRQNAKETVQKFTVLASATGAVGGHSLSFSLAG
jgi:hypothetical protein